MWRHPAKFSALVTAAVLLWAVNDLHAQKRKKYEEPKSQVLPLPKEPPFVLSAPTNSLDFHISPLYKTGGLSAQIRRSLNDLIHDTRGETIIKLRAFVSGVGDARRVQAEVSSLFTERKLPLPVLTIIQIGRLGEDLAQVVIEAVVSTPRNLNPNGLAFLSGQTGKTLNEALIRLRDNAAEVSVSPDQIVSCTCFTSQLQDWASTRSAVTSLFPQTSINVVQPLRDPVTQSSTCQAIGKLSRRPENGSLVRVKNARTSLVSSERLLFTGLQLSFGSFLDDAKEAFTRFQRSTSSVAATESPVQVNAFALDLSAASALRKTASFPPSTFTAETVEGLPSIDATGGVEAILAPDLEPASVLER